MGSAAAALAEPIESVTEPIEPIESTEPTEPVEVEEPVEPIEGAEEPISGLPLFKQAQKTFETLKAEGKIDAKLAKQITAALIRDGKGSQALPDGYEKAAQTIKDIAGLAYPGKEGAPLEQVMTEVKAELAGWRDFDVKISKGDVSVIDELVTASPEGFQNLIPAALNHYAQLNPEGYSALVTKAVVSDMNAAEIPLQLRMMEAFLPRLADSPEKSELIKAYNALVGWTNNLTTLAGKPIKAIKGPDKPAAAQQDPQTVAATREETLTRQLWNAQSNPFGVTMIGKEATRIAGANLSQADQDRIRVKVDEELAFRFSQDTKFKDSMNSYLKAKNYEGYRRLLHSKYAAIIPTATARAIADLNIKTVKGPAPKVGAQPGLKVVPKVAAKTVPGEPVYEKIPGHPRTQQGMARIDLSRTDTAMLNQGKSVLIGGRKVRWR